MEFEIVNNEKVTKQPPKKVGKKKFHHTGVRVRMGNVNVYLRNKDIEGIVDSDEVVSIQELIELQHKIEGIISSIEPPLYSIFQSAKTGILEPYVAVGDRVKYAKAIYMPVNTELTDTFIVRKVEMAAIGNMSIFVAALDNGDTSIQTNFLKKV